MFKEKLVESAVLEDEPQPAKGKLAFRASEGGKCARYLCYRRVRTEPKPPSQKLLLFQDGHMHHNDVRRRLSQFFELLHVEEAVKKRDKATGVIVQGHPDGAIQHPKLGLVVFDVKSANQYSFDDFCKRGKTRENYEIQLLLYMWILGAPVGVILVKNKNRSDFEEFYVEYDPARVRKQLDRFARVRHALMKKKICKREFALGSQDCSWCSFNIQCWKRKAKGIRPQRRMSRKADLSGDTKAERVLEKTVRRYQQLTAELRYIKAKRGIYRETLLAFLAKVNADELVAGGVNVSRLLKERTLPDRVKIAELVEAGMIDTESTAYYELSAEVVE